MPLSNISSQVKIWCFPGLISWLDQIFRRRKNLEPNGNFPAINGPSRWINHKNFCQSSWHSKAPVQLVLHTALWVSEQPGGSAALCKLICQDTKEDHTLHIKRWAYSFSWGRMGENKQTIKKTKIIIIKNSPLSIVISCSYNTSQLQHPEMSHRGILQQVEAGGTLSSAHGGNLGS